MPNGEPAARPTATASVQAVVVSACLFLIACPSGVLMPERERVSGGAHRHCDGGGEGDGEDAG